MATQVLHCPGCNVKYKAKTYDPAKEYKCPKCGGRLKPLAGREDASAGITLHISGTPKPDAAKDPLVGRKIAKYRIVNKLGEGGMGAVYQAVHLDLDRTVALKILPPRLVKDDPDALERFKREARSAAALNHPNVVTIYSVGSEGPHHFIEQEYIDGESLHDRLGREKRLAVDEATRIVQDAAAGLAAAHKQSIIHRDIKPGNIMLTRDGQVKVMDFGLAKDVTAPSQLSVSGQIIGTPYYMSPEQCQGKKGDGRSDIYSLGVMFYQMLTGQLPFSATSAVAVLVKHTSEPAPDPRSIQPDLPDVVCRIIDKTLAKDPGQRYQTCAELIEDLSLGHAPSQPEPSVPEPDRDQPLTSAQEEAETGFDIKQLAMLPVALLILMGRGLRDTRLGKFVLRVAVLIAALWVVDRYVFDLSQLIEKPQTLTVAKLTGRAERMAGDAKEGVPLGQGGSVRKGDTVLTHEDSTVDLELDQATTIRVLPESRVRIDESVMRRHSLAKRLIMRLIWGRAIVIASESQTPRHVEIRTLKASSWVGKQNVVFGIARGDERTSVQVVKGSAQVASTRDTKKAVRVRAKEQLDVGDEAISDAARKPIAAERLDELYVLAMLGEPPPASPASKTTTPGPELKPKPELPEKKVTSSEPVKTTLTVKQDGTGDYKTIAEAVLAVPERGTVMIADSATYTSGFIGAEFYKHPGREPVSKNGITICAAPGAKPVIQLGPQPERRSFAVAFGTDWTFRGLTIKGFLEPLVSWTAIRLYRGGSIEDCRFERVQRAVDFLNWGGTQLRVRNCVFVNCTGFCVKLRFTQDERSSHDGLATVEHNVFYGCGLPIPHYGPDHGWQVRVRGNILCSIPSNVFLDQHVEGVPAGKLKWESDSNCFWEVTKPLYRFEPSPDRVVASLQKGQAGLRDWQRKMGQDKNSIYADPKFVDPERGDFRLRPDSPCRGKGPDGKDMGVLRDELRKASKEAAGAQPHPPFLGIEVVDAAAAPQAKEGLLVAAVERDSAAQAAGILPNDVIVRLNGSALRDLDALEKAITVSGPQAVVVVLRGGKSRSLVVKFGAQPADKRTLGARVVDAAKVSTAVGACVTRVYPDSPAASAGILIGDVITRVGEHPITDAASMRAAIVQSKPGDEASFRFQRAGAQQEVRLVLAPPRVPPGSMVPEDDKDQHGNPVVTRNGGRIDPTTGYPYEIWLEEPRIEFVLIPAGEFLMGSSEGEIKRVEEKNKNDVARTPDMFSRESPQHRVRITKPFYMAKYETTVTQFRWFVDKRGYRTDTEKSGGARMWVDGKWQKVADVSWRNPYFEQRDQNPVTCVSWNDATAFCKALTHALGLQIALPTEAQWEYACRAGSTGQFCYADNHEANQLGEYAWYRSNSDKKTHSVGQRKANAWGLYDLHGNLWESCQDWYGEGYYGSSTRSDPRGPSSGTARVLRGGSWGHGSGVLRSAFRGKNSPDDSSNASGFRCAVVLLAR